MFHKGVFISSSEGKGEIRMLCCIFFFFFSMPLAPSTPYGKVALCKTVNSAILQCSPQRSGSQKPGQLLRGPEQGPFLKVWVSAKLGTLLQASESQ